MNILLIKHRLLDKRLSQVELARLTGMAYDRLIRVLNGYRRIKPDEIALIAKALDLPVEAICDREGEQP